MTPMRTITNERMRTNGQKVLERIIFERETRPAQAKDGCFTDAGAALSAGLAAGVLKTDENGRVVGKSGDPQVWKPAAGHWGPDWSAIMADWPLGSKQDGYKRDDE